jgi:hypothetical protein
MTLECGQKSLQHIDRNAVLHFVALTFSADSRAGEVTLRNSRLSSIEGAITLVPAGATTCQCGRFVAFG